MSMPGMTNYYHQTGTCSTVSSLLYTTSYSYLRDYGFQPCRVPFLPTPVPTPPPLFLKSTIERRKEFLTRIIRGEEMDIGMYGQKQKPKLSVRIKASDQLNQMEGVYIMKIESKTAQLVELVIVTADPALKDGVVEHEDRL